MSESSRQNTGTKLWTIAKLTAKAMAVRARGGGRLLRNTVRDPALVCFLGIEIYESWTKEGKMTCFQKVPWKRKSFTQVALSILVKTCLVSLRLPFFHLSDYLWESVKIYRILSVRVIDFFVLAFLPLVLFPHNPVHQYFFYDLDSMEKYDLLKWLSWTGVKILQPLEEDLGL